MSIEYIKNQIASLNFNEDIDIVTFRYLLMHLLATYANEYRKISHTREGLKMLQAHKKLEYIAAGIKEQYRNNTLEAGYVTRAKYLALEQIQELSSQTLQISAA